MRLGAFGGVWNRLGASGIVWMRLEASASVWRRLGASGCVGKRLQAFSSVQLNANETYDGKRFYALGVAWTLKERVGGPEGRLGAERALIQTPGG